MISTSTLKPLKRKLQYACSLIILGSLKLLIFDFCSNFKAYDTSVMLALKRFISSLVLAFKSPNKRICSFFGLLFLLIHEKYRVLCFETSKF